MSHPAVRFLLRTVEAILLVALLGGAALAWRLSQGPISISGIAPYVAETLGELDPSLSFHIERAQFSWTALKGRPEITMGDIRVQDSGGAVIAGLPSMVVRLSGQALLRGIIAPNRVVLSNPIIRFVHRADGGVGLGIEGTVPGAPAVPTVPTTPSDIASGTAVARSLISVLTRPAPNGRAQFLDSVAIENSTLVLVDERSGQRWIAPDATLRFTRAEGDLELRATLPVVEDGKRWNLTAQGRYVGATDRLQVDLNVEGFRPARVAALAPQLKPLEMIDLRLSGTVAATFQFSANNARIGEVRFEVKGQDGQLKLPAPVARDYPVKNLLLKGAAGADLDQISIEQFRVDFDRKSDPVSILLSAQGKALNSAPALSVEAHIPQMTLVALKDYWPATIKPNTIAWISKNLTLGALSDTHLKLNLAGANFADLDASGLLLTESKLRGITVTYIDRMPKVQGTDGVMTITDHEVVVDVSSGFVPDSLSGKGLRIPGGKLRLYDLGSKHERADFKIKLLGDFGEALRVVDHEPLGYVGKMGLDAATGTGAADIDLGIAFPLIKDLRFDQIEINALAKVTDGGLANVAFGLPVKQANVSMKLTTEGMDVAGNAMLENIPATVEWRENFGSGEFRSKYVIDAVMDNAQRPLVGLSASIFASPYLDGPAKAHVTYVVSRDDTARLDARMDLNGPIMAIPELGWHKKTGEAAEAVLTASFAHGRLTSVPTFRVTSADAFDISGAVTFAPDQALSTLSLNPSVIGETHLQGSLARSQEGAYTVDVFGPAFNSTYFWKELNRDDVRGTAAREAKTAPQTPLKLSAKFDRMWLTPGADFENVNVTLERSPAGIQHIDLRSMVNGATPFDFVLTTNDGKRVFQGTSADGGAVVRAIGMFGDISGGKLELNGEVAPDGTLKGTADINEFKLKEAPVIARLLSVAALTGILDELRGNGISFKKLHVPFSYANSILTIRDGEMFGNSLGLTGKGTYNLADSNMDIEGTVVPAYAINSVLNSIPLVGGLLSGGDKGGGIFAATYTYKGLPATAQPAVNPLAVLTPGFLRHIFDIFKPRPAPQQAATPETPQPPAADSPPSAN